MITNNLVDGRDSIAGPMIRGGLDEPHAMGNAHAAPSPRRGKGHCDAYSKPRRRSSIVLVAKKQSDKREVGATRMSMLGVGSGPPMTASPPEDPGNTVVASNGPLARGIRLPGNRTALRGFACPGGPVDFHWRTLPAQRLGSWQIRKACPASAYFFSCATSTSTILTSKVRTLPARG